MADKMLRLSGQIGGITLNGTFARDGEGQISEEVVLPAAKAGTLSTRTDNDTGVLTLGSGHGITTGAMVDLYWSGGKRTGVTVGTVSGTSVPIDLGSGDNLPAQTTAITVAVQVPISVQFDGDKLQLLCVLANRHAHVTFTDDVAGTVGMELTADEPVLYYTSALFTNPFAGDMVVSAVASNGDSAGAATLKVAAVADSA